MGLHRLHEGMPYYFASKYEGHDAEVGGHKVGWGDEGVAPHPEYPLRVVPRGSEPLPFSMQGRTFSSEGEALAFVQRARSSCVLLDARGRFAGGVFYGDVMTSRQFLFAKGAEFKR